MYLERHLKDSFLRALEGFPAVLLTGPRQSGKTTFLKMLPAMPFEYVSFDDPLERQFAEQDPQGFLSRFRSSRVVLDEIQHVPTLFPYLKMRIDADRHGMGKWILTGSHQFSLMKSVSESLAGRIAILELLPFSCAEMPASSGLSELLWSGLYPEPALDPSKRTLWMKSYIQTYLERDLRQILLVKDQKGFEHFLSLAASRHSQEFHSADYAKEVGVSLPTIKGSASALQASYLVYSLKPFYRNWGKRLIKAPKMYFLDSGIPSYLTRQPDADSMAAGAMGGAFFEGLMVSEAVKFFLNSGQAPDLYFWRSNDGLELDLILRIGGKWHPIEIKSTETPKPKHWEGLQAWKSLAGGEKVGTGLILCKVKEPIPLPFGNLALPWRDFPAWMSSLSHRIQL